MDTLSLNVVIGVVFLLCTMFAVFLIFTTGLGAPVWIFGMFGAIAAGSKWSQAIDSLNWVPYLFAVFAILALSAAAFHGDNLPAGGCDM